MSNTNKPVRQSISRLNKFLAKIAGKDVGEIEPRTVTEKYLNEIAENGIGGAGPFVVTFSGTTADGNAACDRTFVEILKAFNAGQNIVCRHMETKNGQTSFMSSNVYGITDDSFNASSNYVYGSLWNVYEYLVNVKGGVDIVVKQYDIVPHQTENAG